jgi:hypothetical protein
MSASEKTDGPHSPDPPETLLGSEVDSQKRKGHAHHNEKHTMNEKDMHTMTRATRNREPDPTNCAAQILGLMRKVNEGTARPRVCGPARVRCQRLGPGVNGVDRDVLPEWKRADRVGLNQKSSAIFAVGQSNGGVATTRVEK